jgi:hypothetical protein
VRAGALPANQKEPAGLHRQMSAGLSKLNSVSYSRSTLF